jgi:FAD/FMN-containing dehydrogenase
MVQNTLLSKIIDAEKITIVPAVLDAYSRDMSFVKPIRPAYVAKPTTGAEIKDLVQWAKGTQTPIVPVSSGAPHFRGDSLPSLGGALIVDLSRMKKILHIDRKNRVAMFEPGVTFSELSKAVGEQGLRLNMPLLPRSTKSVAGSLLEREPVQMPAYHWDIADPLACTEVVFGTGEIFRTGAAAGSGSIEEQWAAGGSQKEAAGPSSASWYRLIQGSQGTMGIVTWVSARCERIPRMESPYFIGSSQLAKLLDAMRWLIRLRLVNECFILNNINLALIVASQTGADYRQLKLGLPPWILVFNIAAYEYLSEDRIAGQTLDMRDLVQRLGVEAVQALGRISAADFLSAIKEPSPDPYWKVMKAGNCTDIFFLAMLEKIPEMVKTMNDEAAVAGCPATSIGIYIQPIVQGSNCHCEFNIFFDPNEQGEARQVHELSVKAVKQLLRQGAFFSRPYPEIAPLVMNRDAATVQILKKVKSIVDPDHLMNPGKLCF